MDNTLFRVYRTPMYPSSHSNLIKTLEKRIFQSHLIEVEMKELSGYC